MSNTKSPNRIRNEQYAKYLEAVCRDTVPTVSLTFYEFKDMAKQMEDILLPSYVGGEGSRKEAWAAWVKVAGSSAEARRIFQAVDAITPMT